MRNKSHSGLKFFKSVVKDMKRKMNVVYLLALLVVEVANVLNQTFVPAKQDGWA